MTSRNITSEMVDEFVASTVRPFFLFEGIFASSTLRLCDGYSDLSWDSQTWLGNGWLQGFSDFGEGNEIKATGVDVLLSGVPAAMISLLLTEARHSNRGSIWVGCFDSNRDIVADPYLLFEGALSAPRIDDSSDKSQVVLSYENDLIMLARSKELRYNAESQAALFPGDRGFEYVAAIQQWKGFWGNKEKPKEAESATKTKTNRR